MDAVSTISIAAEKLARMVALAETFRGNDGPEATVARIHRKDAYGNPVRPCASIAQGETHRMELISGGDQNYLRASGQLFLYLSRDTPPEFYSDRTAADADAANWFGLVVEQIAALSAADDPQSPYGESHLPIVRMDRLVLDESAEEDWNSLGRFYFTAYSVDWGDQ